MTQLKWRVWESLFFGSLLKETRVMTRESHDKEYGTLGIYNTKSLRHRTV